MSNNGSSSATSHMTRVPLGDWSRSEYLYIQLHSELLLAAACLPTTPLILIDKYSDYISYCQYLARSDTEIDGSVEAGSGVVKSLDAFIDKRNKLVGAILWTLQEMNNAVDTKDGPMLHSIEVSPKMFQDYHQIRKRIGMNTYVYDLKLCPELWSFLQDAVRNQFPHFGGDVTHAEPTRDVHTNSDMDVNMDSAPAVGPVPANDLAATSDHDSANKDEMSDADTDTDTDEHEDDDAEDNVNPGTTQPGPDDFAKETGRIRCTEYAKETGERCRRQAKTENEDRQSWKCHNHDPVRKRQILTDRLARNRAGKAGK